MKTKYQKYALSLVIALLISLLLCLGLEKWFTVDLPFEHLFVMAAIVIILKLMNKILNMGFFKHKSATGTGSWLKQLLEVLVMTVCLVFILSGLSLIGYETLSFKKSLLLVIAAVPGLEFFLAARRYVAKTTAAAAVAPAPAPVPGPTPAAATVPEDEPEADEKPAPPEAKPSE